MKKFITMTLLVLILGFVSLGAYHKFYALPNQTSTLFSGSGNCTTCHSAAPGVLTSSNGRDISPPFHWQSSMMANAAKDPLWKAKVSAEVTENPHLKAIIEDKCTTCHAPMGRTEYKYTGGLYYSISQMNTDPLALDGVSCTACHQIQSENLDQKESFSGAYLINNTKTIFGPYTNPTTMPMFNSTGYTPSYAQHISSSALCATCHTLITPYVNSAGEITGYFPEQMPYFEWKNSIYATNNQSCQKCHMPHNQEAQIISSRPGTLTTYRTPIFEHHFVGGNKTLNRILKLNSSALGIESLPETLDTTLTLTQTNLENKSVDMSVNAYITENKLDLKIKLTNKTGHKFPSGFPSRIAWLHVTVKNNDGITVFESGKYNEIGQIEDLEEHEPHYDSITNPNQVQAYQTTMGNTDDEITYTLLRASHYIKDNRIPPKGFTYNQPYDSLIAVIGNAFNDANFNRNTDGSIGSGSDEINYIIDINNSTLTYEVELCYQTLAYYYFSQLSSISTTETATFSGLYSDSAIPKTQIVSTIKKEINTTALVAAKQNINSISLNPNPASPESVIKLCLLQPEKISFQLFTIRGELIGDTPFKNYLKGENIVQFKDLGVYKTGSYILSAITDNKKHKSINIIIP